MKLNQKGFSVIEVLVIILFVGLIGAVGWLVYDRQKSNKSTETIPTTSTSIEQKEEIPREEIKKEYTYEGWKSFDDANISMRYPEDWTTYKETNQPDWTFFNSSDYIPATELGPSVNAGQWLEVMVAKSESYDSYESDLKNTSGAMEAHGGTFEIIKIDGNNAVMSNISSHGSYWGATTYKNGKKYYFRLNVIDEDKPEVKELFESILASVKIK